MSNNHPVYFIGIALPPELNECIDALKWQIHKEVTHSLKPLVPHITLLHPPSLRGISPGELLPKIREVAAPYLPLTVSLETVGAFDNTVLYMSAYSPELEALHAQLVGLLPTETQEVYYQRVYMPHVTLAQARKPYLLDIETLSKRVRQEIALPRDFTVDSISCFTQIRSREYQARTMIPRTTL
jgi:2'-5' RNA ligase